MCSYICAAKVFVVCERTQRSQFRHTACCRCSIFQIEGTFRFYGCVELRVSPQTSNVKRQRRHAAHTSSNFVVVVIGVVVVDIKLRRLCRRLCRRRLCRRRLCRRRLCRLCRRWSSWLIVVVNCRRCRSSLSSLSFVFFVVVFVVVRRSSFSSFVVHRTLSFVVRRSSSSSFVRRRCERRAFHHSFIITTPSLCCDCE